MNTAPQPVSLLDSACSGDCTFDLQRAMGSACASDLSTNDVNRTVSYCDNLKSIDIKSDAVLPIFLSQAQHECCLFVVSSSACTLCHCWDF